MEKRIRLNKYLSLCGFGSRRGVEDLIREGRVSQNGARITNLAIMVDPATDSITVDGREISPRKKFLYIILFKPKGYITTMEDERNRPIVMDLIPQRFRDEGVFPVGRLDKDTEGLLLFTNDGDLAHSMNHARFGITKQYIVNIDKPLEEQDKKTIEKGMYLHQIDVRTRGAIVELMDNTGKYLQVTLSEGKKRQIRYTFQNLGYKVTALRRITYGPLTLKGLTRGTHRVLRPGEVEELKKICPSSPARKPADTKRSRAGIKSASPTRGNGMEKRTKKPRN